MGLWGADFLEKTRQKGKRVGRVGGGVGTGRATGKSVRKLCRNYPLANYPLVSPRIIHRALQGVPPNNKFTSLFQVLQTLYSRRQKHPFSAQELQPHRGHPFKHRLNNSNFRNVHALIIKMITCNYCPIHKNLEDRNLLKLRSLDSSCPFFLRHNSIWGQWTQKLQTL